MKYPEDFINKIICGNCLDILPLIPNESIDLIVTDPPYGVSKNDKISRKRDKGKFRGKDITLNFGDWDIFYSEKDFFEFTFKWLNECIRILKKGGMLISYFDKERINIISYYLKNHGFKTKDYFAHIKSNPAPQARKVKWMQGWEIVGLWQKLGGKPTFNYQLGQQTNYMIVPVVNMKERLNHPTQKPERIIELFVKFWSKEGDIVLDPFAGVGTTCAVCVRLKRRFIGIEINEKYCKIAEERLRKIDKSISYFI